MKLTLSKEETVSLGMRLYLDGHNCGEATSTALMRALGYNTDLFPRAGTVLGGGFGGEHRYQCGALSSGILAAGAALGRNHPDDDRQPAYDFATQFTKDFETQFSSIYCYEIVGLPPASGDEWNVPYRQQNKRQERCVNFVRYALEHWYDMAEKALK
jgi:C_GCAxxG_C_C family probable redox protein